MNNTVFGKKIDFKEALKKMEMSELQPEPEIKDHPMEVTATIEYDPSWTCLVYSGDDEIEKELTKLGFVPGSLTNIEDLQILLDKGYDIGLLPEDKNGHMMFMVT